MEYKLKMTARRSTGDARLKWQPTPAACARISNSARKMAAAVIRNFLYQVLGEVDQMREQPPSIFRIRLGYTIPDEFGKLISGIIKNTPGIEKCIISVHCHNDLGLATANTLAGITGRSAPGRGDDQWDWRTGRQHLSWKRW